MSSGSVTAVLPDETLDALFHGKLKVIQKKKGYRFSLDAVLVARLAPISQGDRIIELGTGCGIICLIIACSGKAKEIVGVEIQEELADIAVRNVQLNALQKVVKIQREDLKNLPALYPPESFDCVLANPPFRKLHTGRMNPQNQKAIARHEIAVSLQSMLKVAYKLLKQGGKIFLIYPAIRLVDLFYEMRNCGLEPKTLQLVCSGVDLPAKMVLVEGIKKGGVELYIQKPLIIYDTAGHYTRTLQEIFSLPR